MKKVSFRDLAEIAGFVAVIASLIFVGLELRQSQQVAQTDAGATRATWFFDNRAAINQYADIWLKGNSGAELSDNEALIYSNLIRNFHTNNGFTWRRERALGIEGSDYAADELAWFLHKYPAARKVWEAYSKDLRAMNDALNPNTRVSETFGDVVRAKLEKLSDQ